MYTLTIQEYIMYGESIRYRHRWNLAPSGRRYQPRCKGCQMEAAYYKAIERKRKAKARKPKYKKQEIYMRKFRIFLECGHRMVVWSLSPKKFYCVDCAKLKSRDMSVIAETYVYQDA